DLLKKFATLLKNELRTKDHLFRFHQKGDEFLILLDNTTLENGKLVAHRLRILVSETTFEIGDSQEKVTFSTGVTSLNLVTDDSLILINRLNSALKEAKSAEGKNSVGSIV